jgi:protein arginine N-methyltransferase 1
MYSLPDYGRMIADRVRMDAYLEAMARVITPGAVVIDLGAGPGVLALHACRMGAGRVYAIEPDNSIAAAVALARANGLGDRITFFQDFAERIDLPEKADVLVSDLRGALPLHGSHLAVVAQARRRWLRDGGVQIPLRDTLRAGLVRDLSQHESLTAPWKKSGRGFDLAASLQWCLNQPQKVTLKADALAGEPGTWGILDYTAGPPAAVAGTVEWVIEQPSVVCGLAAWFDAELIEGVGFSNRPGPDAAIYGQMFFPWPRPVELKPSDRVEASLAATPHGSDYGWRWTTKLFPAAGPAETFVQGSFLGTPIGPRTLARRREGHVPRLSEGGEATRVALEAMAAGLTLEQIAQRLLERCDGQFAGDLQRALTFAADAGDRFAD